MPNLADWYRRKVSAVQYALAGQDATAVRGKIRALIDEIRIIHSATDPKAVPAIEVRGASATMLALGSGSIEAAASALALR